MRLQKLFIILGVIFICGIVPVIPMQYTAVVEHPGPSIEILASFVQMMAYTFFPGSGASYHFTTGSLIVVIVLLLMGWLACRFLLRKFALTNKDAINAKD